MCHLGIHDNLLTGLTCSVHLIWTNDKKLNTLFGKVVLALGSSSFSKTNRTGAWQCLSGSWWPNSAQKDDYQNRSGPFEAELQASRNNEQSRGEEHPPCAYFSFCKSNDQRPIIVYCAVQSIKEINSPHHYREDKNSL